MGLVSLSLRCEAGLGSFAIGPTRSAFNGALRQGAPYIPAPTNISTQCHVKLGLATLNVLTLKGADNAHHGLQGVARQAAILQQLFDIGIHVFALQETRLRRIGSLVSDQYLLLASSASPQGHFGMMMGFDIRKTAWHHHGCRRPDSRDQVPTHPPFSHLL